MVAGASWVAEGAALAALDLERDMVPWYDRLDRMAIKVERDGEEDELVLVDENESVPAGTAYRTSDSRALQISANIYTDGGQRRGQLAADQRTGRPQSGRRQ